MTVTALPRLMNLLIDQTTGEIDAAMVAEVAQLQADRDYGGPAPPNMVRGRLQAAQDRAHGMRLCWRRDRGLPSDDPCSLVSMPAWGASGDSFGAQ